ncbi:hypothetical protein LCGC14_1020950, partial [marine sediment metagenome]
MPELPDLDWFKGRANYLEEQNKDRDKMYEALDSYRHGEWSMDEEMTEIDWVHESRDPIFAQQSDSAKHILADVNPSISLTPYDPGDEGTGIADRHEKGLRWLLDSASRRRQATIVQDVVSSAVDYAEVTAQVVYIPQQIKDIKAAGGNAKRYEAMLRRGPFAVIIHNPKTVYARYSDMGAEEVVLKTEDDPHNVIDLWGEKADKLKKKLKDSKGAIDFLDASTVNVNLAGNIAGMNGDATGQTKNSGNSKVNKFFGKLGSLGITLDVIENPLSVVQLVMGQDIDLITWDVPELDLGITIEKSFPLIMGINGLLRGGFNVHSDLVFGFDTHGFSQWKETDFALDKSYL